MRTLLETLAILAACFAVAFTMDRDPMIVGMIKDLLS